MHEKQQQHTHTQRNGAVEGLCLLYVVIIIMKDVIDLLRKMLMLGMYNKQHAVKELNCGCVFKCGCVGVFQGGRCTRQLCGRSAGSLCAVLPTLRLGRRSHWVGFISLLPHLLLLLLLPSPPGPSSPPSSSSSFTSFSAASSFFFFLHLLFLFLLLRLLHPPPPHCCSPPPSPHPISSSSSCSSV